LSQAPTDYRPALEAVERILNRGGHSDDVLREVLNALHARGVAFGLVRFAAGDRFADGPSVGERASALQTTVVFAGETVGVLELEVDDAQFAARVATLISPYVRSGRDIRGG
jgi:hypothetical protein